MQDSPASKLTLLLIEDEEDLAYQLQRFLIKRGYAVQISFDIKHSLALITEQTFDAVLLDRLLPDGDALEEVNKIKAHHAGLLLIMSALGRVKDRIAAFDLDVDYYLPKPVDLDELLAILEHYSRVRPKPAPRGLVSAGAKMLAMPWQLQQRELVSPEQISMTLTAREALILNHLIARPGEVVTRSELIAAMHKDPEHYDPKALDSTMYRIRHKIEDATAETVPFETVHGVGYVWHG